MPLTAEEKAWAEKKIATGAPKEQVFEFLASKRGLGAAPAVNVPMDPGRPMKADFAQDEANRQRQYQRDLMAAGVQAYGGAVIGPMLGNAASGALISKIPALAGTGRTAAIARTGIRIGGEMAGQFGGSLTGDVATGQPMDPGKATKAALWQGGLSTAGAAGANLLGRLGGVSGEAANAAMGRPDFVTSVPKEADDLLARKINQTAADIPKTPGRMKIEGMIAAHDQGGKTIDVLPLAQKAFSYSGRGGVHPATVAADRTMRGVADRLLNRLIQEAPGGQITAEAADRIIREEFTRQLQGELLKGGKAGGSVAQGRIAALRQDLQAELYKALGPGAQEAGASASTALRASEKVRKYFPVDEFGDPRLSSPGRVAAAGGAANPSGPTVLKKLQEFDDINGTNLRDEVVTLDQKRQWGPGDERRASYISSMLQLGKGGGPGNIRTGIRVLARQLVRSQGIVGAGLRGAAVAYPSQMDAFQRAMQEKQQTP